MVGTNNLWSSKTRYNVTDVKRHENYNNPWMANDIAIVEINGNFAFNDKVQPIKYSNQRVKEHTIVQAVGWGRFGVRSFNFFSLKSNKIQNKLMIIYQFSYDF